MIAIDHDLARALAPAIPPVAWVSTASGMYAALENGETWRASHRDGDRVTIELSRGTFTVSAEVRGRRDRDLVKAALCLRAAYAAFDLYQPRLLRRGVAALARALRRML